MKQHGNVGDNLVFGYNIQYMAAEHAISTTLFI